MPPGHAFSITFVGTGVSTGIPVVGHVGRTCACADAIANPRGYNARNNVSLLITIPPDAAGVDDGAVGGAQRHVLIDCGKTFRDAYFRVLAPRGVTRLDALLLTHDHADAVQGLDDLRDIQQMTLVGDDWLVDEYIPVYLSARTIAALEQQVGYIMRNSRRRGAAPANEAAHQALTAPDHERNIGPRRSTALDLFTLPDDAPAPFFIPSLGTEFPMYTLPVEHGKGYMSLGFVFGPGLRLNVETDASAATGKTDAGGGACVVYISDCSEIPSVAMDFLLGLDKIDILVIDTLLGPGRRHATHYGIDDAIALVERLAPRRTYCIGMYCELDHIPFNAYLKELLARKKADGSFAAEVELLELAYDGLEIEL